MGGEDLIYAQEIEKENLEIAQKILGVTRSQENRWKAPKVPVKGQSEPRNSAHSMGDTNS